MSALCKKTVYVGSVGLVESYFLSASYKKLYGSGAHMEPLVGGSKTDSRSLFTASNYDTTSGHFGASSSYQSSDLI